MGDLVEPPSQGLETTLGYAETVGRLPDGGRNRVSLLDCRGGVVRHSWQGVDAATGFIALLCISGSIEIRVCGQSASVMPGDVLIREVSRSGNIEIEDALVAYARIDEDVLDAVYGRQGLPEFAILRGALAQAASAMLHQVVGAEPARNWRGDFAASVVLGLGQIDPLSKQARLMAVRDAIDAQLADRSLDGETIARATLLSRSTLYRLLEPFGGIGRCISRRRLAMLRTLLADPNSGEGPQSREGLAELAERVGFASASHVSRLFLDKYGLRPGEFRKAMRADDPAPYATMCFQLWRPDFATAAAFGR